MEILEMFGLEKSLFLFQLINFLIIAYCLKRFLYKPLKKALDERKSKIEKGLLDAQDAKAALENAAQERREILIAAKLDADKLADAEKTSLAALKEQFLLNARKRSETIIEEARNKASDEFDKMNKQVGQMSLSVSSKVLARVIGDLFTDEERRKILSRALEKIEKVGYEKSSN